MDYPNSDWPDNIHRFCEGTGIGYRPNGTPYGSAC